MASSTKKISAHNAPIHASRVPVRFNQPLCAPYATTAGAVSERNPAITPIRNASSSTSDELIRGLLAMPSMTPLSTLNLQWRKERNQDRPAAERFNAQLRASCWSFAPSAFTSPASTAISDAPSCPQKTTRLYSASNRTEENHGCETRKRRDTRDGRL